MSKSPNEANFQRKLQLLIKENHLLHHAVKASNEALYRYFLSVGAEGNSLDEEDCSPLFYAVQNQDKKAVQMLCKRGCRVECPRDTLWDCLVLKLKSDNL
jgi:ankyrin repeat protein